MSAKQIELSDALRMAIENAGFFKKGFIAWLSDNEHIYREFCVESNKIYSMGRKHYSARTIIEFIRHNSELREASGGYKINNCAVPDMVRLYIMQHPGRESFFELREPTEAAFRLPMAMFLTSKMPAAT